MERFEYEISKHPADTFKQLVYFCSEAGECRLEQIPGDQTGILANILNERGDRGWELVEIYFGKDGLMAIWKRRIREQ